MTIDITEHLPLVGWVVDRYYSWCINGRIEREDLVSEGYTGLIKAAEKFDPNRGFQFCTYAVHWVRSYIQRYIQNHRRLVRVPIYLQEGEHGKQLQPERLLWLDRSYSHGDASTAYNFMGSDDPAQSHALAADDVETLLALIKDKRTRFVVRQRYLKHRTLEEIGANLGGLSRERVRQLESQGLAEMRRAARRRTVRAVELRELPPRLLVTEQQEQRWREALAIYNKRGRALPGGRHDATGPDAAPNAPERSCFSVKPR
jgi:RNA polymerase sigma factor (sigma-70 family)